MSAIDATIDALYRLPLNEFTGARNALAKSLSGGDASRVRALAKPTVVPWAVNQVYWRARGTHDRLMKSGETLRAAQIAALEGRPADVRAASDAHRRAIGEAVAEAGRLAAPAGAEAGADALARTFEALSLATTASQSPGRLTAELQPAGFETLAGIQIVEPSDAGRGFQASDGASDVGRGFQASDGASDVGRGFQASDGASDVGRGFQPRQTTGPERAALRQTGNAKTAAKEAKERERAAEAAARAAAERKKHEAAVKDAEAHLARAEAAERASRDTWEHAHEALLDARHRLAEIKSQRGTLNPEPEP